MNTIRTVRSSTASTDLTPASLSMAVQPVGLSMQNRHVKTTSSLVKSLPSDHVTPSINCHVIDRLSLAKPPFSRVGISSASFVVIRPSGS